MGIVKALFDTNILIDYLNGVDNARDEIRRFEPPLISPVSWMEVMVGTDEREEKAVRRFLARFSTIPIDSQVAELSVQIRKQYRMRLPDAIIWASAKSANALLISRNTKDFPESEPDIRVPYQLRP